MRSRSLSVLFVALLLFFCISAVPTISITVQAQDQPSPGVNTLSPAQVQALPSLLSRQALVSSLIRATDVDWSGFSVCSDCAQGWADDTWELTLTKERVVTFLIEDCCIVGDYYELWVDGKIQGTTQKVAIFGPTSSSGTFVVTLKGGTHQIRIRDAAFKTFSPSQLSFMCPAGFFLTWTLGEEPNPWWRGALGALRGVGKQIGMTAAEVIATIKGWGPTWSGVVDLWKIFKVYQVGQVFTDPDSRASLIDERYYSSSSGPIFRAKVDGAVANITGGAVSSWNDLTFEQKRSEPILNEVYSFLGGSGFIAPQFMIKWLE